MKQALLILLGLALLFPLFASDWTVLVYMAADNNLWHNAVRNINEMESAAIPPGLEIIVQTDMPQDSNYPGCQRRRIRQDFTPYIMSTLLENLGTVNSGDPSTLRDFINWGFQKYPANKKMLVIWGHGDNWFKDDTWKWICPDEGAEDLISVSGGELRQALSDIPHLDILLFDACSMQSLEVLAEVMHAADIVVASEEQVPAAGFPYQDIVPLFSNPDPEAVASQICQKYLDSYLHGGSHNPYGFVLPVTCSAIQTSKLTAFYEAWKDYFLSHGPHFPGELQAFRKNLWEMNTAYNDIDVGELLHVMLDSWEDYEPLLTGLLAKWEACVLASGSLYIENEVGSAALWFPKYQQHFDFWWESYAQLEFARYRWPQMLHRYFRPHGKPPAPELVSVRQVLNTYRIELRQAVYPDSLWYIVRSRPFQEGDQAIFLTPEFGQQNFGFSLPHGSWQWLEISSVNPWGSISDSLVVFLEYTEPGLELLVSPNPAWDRSRTVARWYLPEGSTGRIELNLYNSRGQKVLSHAVNQPEPGEGLWWLATEPEFHKLGRGVFILSLKVGNNSLVRKLAIP